MRVPQGARCPVAGGASLAVSHYGDGVLEALDGSLGLSHARQILSLARSAHDVEAAAQAALQVGGAPFNPHMVQRFLVVYMVELFCKK